MIDHDLVLKEQLKAINSEFKDLSDISSLAEVSALYGLSNISESVLASTYLKEPTLSEQLTAQLESISSSYSHEELVKQIENLHSPAISALDAAQAQCQTYLNAPALESIQDFQSQHEELLAKAASVTSMFGDINFSSANTWQNLYAPAISEIEAAQVQYSEYLNSSAISAAQAIQSHHEEWFSKTSSITSMLESINTSAAKVWEGIDQSMSAIANPLKALGFDSVQDHLSFINSQQSTIEKLSDQFNLAVFGLNTENYLEQLLGNQNASILASLEFSNSTYAETISRANSLAEMFSPIENLVEKYGVMTESLAQIEISNWTKTDFDYATTATSDSWKASPPIELPEADEQKRFREWFNGLPDPVKIFTYFVMLRLLEYAMGIFVNVTTPYWQEKWQGIEQETPKKQIIATASEHLSPVILVHHRFVDVKTVLYVRADAGKKFEVIDTLKRGKIVKLVDKQKAWSLIEYYDSSSEKMIQGWVFSRYLSKLEQ
ncbi:SH3 domain-containing protein [Thiomicrorhabdus sp.]|uniref:SH3 domain-containing protein n=1 Tax=Thiomicrorhabdus sp. TaxID=2039724 RepID=UPI0029C6D865|nr:SH3 domain-containing protein [Thiomicrorhabdus sp.]